MEGRNCTKCKEYKPWKEFSLSRKGFNGRASKCRKCCRVYFKDRYYNQGGKQKGLDYHKNNKSIVKSIVNKYQSKMQPGVYIVYTEAGRYVGESIKMERRVGNHKPWNYDSPVNTKVLKWEILEVVEDTQLRKQREAYWIKKLKPELNQIHNLGR